MTLAMFACFLVMRFFDGVVSGCVGREKLCESLGRDLCAKSSVVELGEGRWYQGWLPNLMDERV